MTYTFNRPAFPATRMRRIRKNDQLRAMVSETQLTTNHLIYPVFVLPGQNQTQDIPSMPNIQRLSADLLLKKLKDFWNWVYRNWLFFQSLLKKIKASPQKLHGVKMV